jgi:hypothetical protein
MADEITNATPSYIVQNAGAATITYSYPANLTGSGADNTLTASKPVALTGFKLNSNYLDTQQALDNSFIIPLLNGGSIQITNDNTCGNIMVNAIRTSPKLSSGDIVAIASAQRAVAGGDSTGATITVKFSFNGTPYQVVFYNCTVAQCKPITLAGNDAPDYQVRFNYSHWDFM